jgi:arabinogalactan endo-1,4-beta-galactosidase
MRILVKYILPCIFFFILFSCSNANTNLDEVPQPEETFIIKGCDISFLPKLRATNTILKNENNETQDMLQTLKIKGVNTVRIRLWKNPTDSNSSFQTVKNLSNECKQMGFKVLLCVHFSDTWADPGTQNIPQEWLSLGFTQLKQAVSAYVTQIIEEINPEFIQIGNEINSGFMWPQGNSSNMTNFKELVQAGCQAVRNSNAATKIVLHYAGHEQAVSFFNNFTNVDYDYIGISYYPNWHGKNLTTLQNNLSLLGSTFNKKVFIAETSYPFTFGYNDNTNNVIGLPNQIMPEYAPTPQGQRMFLQKIRDISTLSTNGIGLVYWGTEWVTFNGTQSSTSDASPWENQALWDFNNKVLPAINVFKN